MPRSPGGARWCCSPVRRAWARPTWPRPRSRGAPRRCAAPRSRPRPPRTGRWWPRCAARLREDPAALDGVRAAAGALALLLPELGPRRATRRAIGRRCSRRCAVRSRPSRPRWCCWTTCSGRTERRWSCWPRWRAPLRELPLLDRRRVPVRRGRPRAPAAAAARRPAPRAGCCASSIVAPLDAAASAELAARDARRGARAARSPTRCTTARRASRSSSRSSPPRCRRATACATGPDGLELDARRRRARPGDDPRRGAAAHGGPARRGPRRRRGRRGRRVGVPARPRARRSTSCSRRGLIVETEPGRGAFRHALVRGAIYEDIPWLRRRDAARRARRRARPRPARRAPRSPPTGSRPASRERALDAFLAAAHELAASTPTATRPPPPCRRSTCGRDGERPAERLAALDAYAHSAELAGDLAEAIRALREAAAIRQAAIGAERRRRARAAIRRRAPRRRAGGGRARRDASGSSPALYELQGDRERALAGAARRRSTRSIAAELPGEAAAERLRARRVRPERRAPRRGGRARAGRRGRRAARRADDLRARALGLEGVARAKRGEYAEGVETIRAGLALALEHELTSRPRSSTSGSRPRWRARRTTAARATALDTAVGLCEATGAGGQEHTCLSCMAYVLRELGDWDEAERRCAASSARARAGRTTRSSRTASSARSSASAATSRGPAAAARAAAATAARLDVVSMGVRQRGRARLARPARG